MKNAREQRLDEFDSRGRAEPSAVYHDEALGAYILIHPLADEENELSRLGMSSASCTKADCYWNYDQDVYFLQVETTNYASREPGLWARISPGEPSYINLVGIVDDPVVTSSAMHRIMRLFQAVPISSLQLESTLRRVDAKQ